MGHIQDSTGSCWQRRRRFFGGFRLSAVGCRAAQRRKRPAHLGLAANLVRVERRALVSPPPPPLLAAIASQWKRPAWPSLGASQLAAKLLYYCKLKLFGRPIRASGVLSGAQTGAKKVGQTSLPWRRQRPIDLLLAISLLHVIGSCARPTAKVMPLPSWLAYRNTTTMMNPIIITTTTTTIYR